jgi:hypothetical protein
LNLILKSAQARCAMYSHVLSNVWFKKPVTILLLYTVATVYSSKCVTGFFLNQTLLHSEWKFFKNFQCVPASASLRVSLVMSWCYIETIVFYLFTANSHLASVTG